MTPLEISLHLASLKTDKAREENLKKIAPDHEFWVGAYHGMRPLVPYPVRFGLRDPSQYGSGVPHGIFTKILNGMHDGTLTEVATVSALTAFSGHCTEEEWKSWYQPIFEKKLRLPVTVTQLNKHCPKEYRLDNPRLPQMAPIARGEPLPTKCVLEPYMDAQRLLILLRQKRTYVFSEDGTPVHRMLPVVFERFATEDGVMLEVYEEEGRYTVRDVLLWEQSIDEVKSAPVEVRKKVLEGMFAGQEVVEVIEGELHNSTDTIREEVSAFLQAGYPGVVIRQKGSSYYDDAANILIRPKRKSVLTCMSIDEGAGGTKYAGRTEYVWGSGTMNRKKIETPVFYGLTFSEREASYQNREQLVGQKFDVISCGLDSDGKLMFPIFKQWKEK
jgi:hypothetical protein